MVVVDGVLVLGALTLRFPEPVPALIFGVYSVALVLLLATDLDQRLLPNELTLPAIPLALCSTSRASTRWWRRTSCRSRSCSRSLVPGDPVRAVDPVRRRGDRPGRPEAADLGGPARRGRTGCSWASSTGRVLAGVVIVVLLVARRITLKTFIPFGPFLIIGALWAIYVIQ